MPWTEKTAKEASAKGHEAKAKYKKDREEFIVGGRLTRSLQLLDEMLEGAKVTKEQIRAIELIRDFLPYEKPKLQAVEQKTEHSGDLNITWT